MKELIESKWDDILLLLETEYDITPMMINTFIRPLKIYEVKDNTVYFYVEENRGEQAVKYFKKKDYDFFLMSSIREILNDINIEIRVDEKKNYIKETEDVKDEPKVVSDSYLAAVKRSNLNPLYTFDNFVVGDSNRHAHATCLAVADLPGQAGYNPLYLYGNSGLGKTHLMHSIAHYILQNNENLNVLYVPCSTFTNDIIESIKNHTTNKFREKYKSVDVLLIDDIQNLMGKESTQSEFFDTFNDLYNANKQIIISSDRPPKELTTLDMRITSRFSGGIPIDIHEPDYETRIAILHNKAHIEHLDNIPAEVFVYIAENFTTNVRELEGALNVLRPFSLTGETLTTEKAIATLSMLLSNQGRKSLTPDYIIEIVSECMGVSNEDIKSGKRSQDIATARQTVMYICDKYSSQPLTLKAIGNALGGKDHSTVINGIKKIESKLKEDQAFKTSFEKILKMLNIST